MDAPQAITIDLVCIAASTGGPNALAAVFSDLRDALPVPVAIVQHMPPAFTRLLADRLDGIGCAVRCREAAQGDVLEPGWAYLAPGGFHLSVTRNPSGQFIAHILETPPENSCRPSADVLFRSAAATGAGLLAVVMTGMGHDGLGGCRVIHQHRGRIVAQDEGSSIVWGMPGAVVQAGLAHAVLPLGLLAAEITARTRRRAGPAPGAHPGARP